MGSFKMNINSFKMKIISDGLGTRYKMPTAEQGRRKI